MRGRCPIIGSPPEKSPPADNLPAKTRPAWRPPGRERFLPINIVGRGRLPGGDLIMGRFFYGASDILIRGKHVNSVIISPPADFFMWKTFECDTGCKILQRSRISIDRLCAQLAAITQPSSGVYSQIMRQKQVTWSGP